MTNSRKKILIVEDDNDLRDLLSKHLNRYYEIGQAEDGEQGLNFIINFKPDLVLLDLLLPKLSGLEMLERVRKHPDAAVAGVKVIVFSNFSTPEFILKARELQVRDYLVKSNTDIKDLIKKIERIIDEPQKI